MGIIRDGDRAAREAFLDEAEKDAQRRAHDALTELKRQLPLIADKVTDNAREWLRLTGRAEVGVAWLPWSLGPIKDDPAAAKMIMDEMASREPCTAGVKFDDDYEYDRDNPIKVIVTFDPPLV